MNLLARLAPVLGALLVAGAQPPGGPAGAPPAATPASTADQGAWTALEPGLDLGVFPGPGATQGDGKIWVVRLDPARFELRLFNASAGDALPRTVRAWTTSAAGVAGINAGMFQADGLTSVGLMRTRAHQNNPRRSSRYKAVLAFDPVDAMLPPVRILDASCGEEPAAPGYGTLIQSIRLVSCEGQNVWSRDEKRWSTAAVGLDVLGRILFIHARSPWPVHDLVDTLLTLPIGVRRAMYVEGGPEAQLYVRSGGREVERLGAFEGTAQHDGGLAWEIPNAIVAVRRPVR